MSVTGLQPKAASRNVCRIEVRLKSDYTDSEGLAALSLLNAQGVNTAREVRTSRIYEIRGALNSGQAQQAAKELLCDCVTQEFRLLTPGPAALNGMNHWRVEVWLKESVTDPVGETVREAIAELGLPLPESVRVASAYHIKGKCGRNQLEKAVLRCLANPVIHRFALSEASL